MRNGARLPIHHLELDRRKKKFRKCPVCQKALHEQNKIGLCTSCYGREHGWNYHKQVLKQNDRR